MKKEEQVNDTSNPIAVRSAPPQTGGSLSAIMPWVLYIIAAVLLGLLAYSIVKNTKTKQRKAYYKHKTKQLTTELEEKNKIVSALTAEHKDLEKKLADSELDIKTLEDRLRTAEKKSAATGKNKKRRCRQYPKKR